MSVLTADRRAKHQVIRHPNASVPITRQTATNNGATFDMENGGSLFATLNIHPFFTTSLAGANNDFVVVQRAPGAAAVSFSIVVAGNNTALSIGVVGNVLTINSATDGSGNPTSTAAQIIAAINASPAASALVYVELAPANDGTGVVAALGSQSVAAQTGTTPTLDVKAQFTVDDGTTFQDAQGGTFAQVTTSLTPAASGVQRCIGPLTRFCRWVFTLGGTTPVYYMSITANFRSV